MDWEKAEQGSKRQSVVEDAKRRYFPGMVAS
jgi:hypothetical protein